MYNILAIFGGASSEHDISVITALDAIRNMPSVGYTVTPIYVRDDKWYTGRELLNLKSYMPFEPNKHDEVVLIGRKLFLYKRYGVLKRGKEVDCALILMHGGLGEGGGIQGLLECHGIPYASSGIEASALCMDKRRTKIFMRGIGVPVLADVCIPRHYSEKELENAEKIGYPLFVKPNGQGSSIGTGVARSREELVSRLDYALGFDENALVEPYVDKLEELNVGVLYAYGKYIVSEAERPLGGGEYLSFENKYMRGSGMAGAEREFPAAISSELRIKLRSTSIQAASAVGLRGIARIDYIKDGDSLYLNEINVIPGSMAHYLFPEYDYTELLKTLIENAIAEGISESKLYMTDVLNRGKGKGV